MSPQFPLYIVSKGRADTRLTMKALDWMKVPYFVVVEAQEHAAYAEVINPAKLLVLDPAYQRDYDVFSSLGVTGTGSGPARNFAGDHSRGLGAPWHWVMDDNIRKFYRLHLNEKIPLGDGTPFRAMEDFVQRFRNVAMAGPNYEMFAPRKQAQPPFTTNTRIYSCNLIRNDLPYRWRGRYNEDTDLSLRMLKDGWCTVLFNAFLQDKVRTMMLSGGNTDTIYTAGTLAKSQMLADMHPDVARVVTKYGRAHHQVDYSGFTQRLVLRADAVYPEGDPYGLAARKIDGKLDQPRYTSND